MRRVLKARRSATPASVMPRSETAAVDPRLPSSGSRADRRRRRRPSTMAWNRSDRGGGRATIGDVQGEERQRRAADEARPTANEGERGRSRISCQRSRARRRTGRGSPWTEQRLRGDRRGAEHDRDSRARRAAGDQRHEDDDRHQRSGVEQVRVVRDPEPRGRHVPRMQGAAQHRACRLVAVRRSHRADRCIGIGAARPCHGSTARVRLARCTLCSAGGAATGAPSNSTWETSRP